jgi:hypothetical protein
LSNTGRRAWFQLKHTSSPDYLSDGSISYSIDTKNLNYLESHPCAFYLLYIKPTKKVYFHWYHDVRGELDYHHSNWNTQKEVQVHFTRYVDDALLKEIETEIDIFAGQTKLLFDGPGFIRHIRGDRARRLFRPDDVFIGRQEYLDALGRRMLKGTVVAITGAPDAGKSELVRHYLGNPSVLDLEKSFGSPLAFLLIDVGTCLGPCLLRSLAYSLGIQKISESDLVHGSSEISKALLLGQQWPGRVQSQNVVVVVDNADACFSDPHERQDLEDFLATDPFRSGCVVIISKWDNCSGVMASQVGEASLDIGELPRSEAKELLECLIDVGGFVIA